MAADKTRDQVREMMDEGKSAKEIAAALDKTPATVYVHIRNIKEERGDKTPAKRGRPPKAKAEGEAKTEAKSEAKPAASKAKTNGHADVRFPEVRAAIEARLKTARADVALLEKMLEATP